ncbi:hypothetical protein BKH46_03205 [Helicobacter sp. 12S02634-8]|uniref:hypothetical protein n=1 Tax=Helicobacter sp. 12S02634-8 TaxID=1476199 RepID=UPI000BA50771|nr:hypothetical protein [Helicobacter sp. 12S02634-8]PAF47851.1 hypothetical protein BKH46_03205 [Helicobacter sp. 12S02634-8]
MDIFGFSKLIKPFFSNVFIAVNIDSKMCAIKILRIKNKQVIESLQKEFKIINNELPMDAIKLIRTYQKKYPFTYLSTMAKTYNQGILKKGKPEDLLAYGLNPKELNILDFENFRFYIKNSAIKENIEKFSKIGGPDYLFSPFALIYHKIKDQLEPQMHLYILQERSCISLLIADNKGVYFGGYFIVEGETEDVSEDTTASMDDIFSTSFLGDQNKDFDDEIDELEDLGDSDFFIDKLNARLLLDSQEDETKGKVDDIAKIATVSSIIQNSLREFYSNELYESQFIEKIFILDTYGLSEGALSYLSENMMIETHKIPASILDGLNGLARIEFAKDK